MKPFKIQFEGRDYEFDVSTVSASEWKSVRHYCGHNPFDLFEAIGRAEIEAIEAAYWLVMRQNREPAFDFGQRQFGLLGFLEGWNVANKAAADEAEAESEKADPKAPPAESGSRSD